MVSDTCVPSLIVIGTAINQLETKVSLKTICCLRLFVYRNIFSGDLPAINICLHAKFKVRLYYGFGSTALQQAEEEEDKEHQKTCFAVFPYVLDIDVTRNGNNLKLKVKSEFSLSMGLVLINHSNRYIHSTIILLIR